MIFYYVRIAERAEMHAASMRGVKRKIYLRGIRGAGGDIC